MRLVLGRSHHQIVWEVEVDSIVVDEFGFVLSALKMIVWLTETNLNTTDFLNIHY